jgi:hypothetical protein
MLAFARMTALEVWTARLDLDGIGAEPKSGAKAPAKLTAMAAGRRQIAADPPLIVPVSELPAGQESDDAEQMICDLLAAYRSTLPEDGARLLASYELSSLARTAVGVGSVGTRCWILLMQDSNDSDPLFLQVKEAARSALSEFAGPSRCDNQAQRVVAGQRSTQAATDVLLGWVRAADGIDGRRHDYYVRHLPDRTLPADPAGLSPATLSAGRLRRYAGYCGWTLARAHARTGDRFAIGGYLGTSAVFDEAVADFAASYANQNERDYADLGRAAKSGRIAVKKSG